MRPSKDAAKTLTLAIQAGMSEDDPMADHLIRATDCPHGCVVDADLTMCCEHGYVPAGLTAATAMFLAKLREEFEDAHQRSGQYLFYMPISMN